MNTILLPIAFGLFGFIEPCAVGATLFFLLTLEGRSDREKVRQVVAFTLTRTVAMGVLGVLAALIGSLFLGLQKAVWIAVGFLYVAVGLLYVTRRISILKKALGPSFASLGSARGSATLGVLFGLNVPACAGPLLLALLATAAAEGASGRTLLTGFWTLALFGFALSLPIVVAVLFPRARRFFDWLAAMSERLPVWTGLVFLMLGFWSIWFGLFVTIA